MATKLQSSSRKYCMLKQTNSQTHMHAKKLLFSWQFLATLAAAAECSGGWFRKFLV